VKPLLPKQGESQTENHSHSRLRCVCYTIMGVPLKWQAWRFNLTVSSPADL